MLRYIILGILAVLPANGLYYSSPYCRNAAGAYEDLFNGYISPGFSTSRAIFSSFRSVQENTLCDLKRTCCSSTAEAIFQLFAVINKKNSISNQLKRSGLISCSNHPIFSETASFIHQSKNQLFRDFQRVYGRFFQDEHLFDRFYDYLANSVHTGDVTDLPAEFTEMFLRASLATFIAVNGISVSDDFRQCFYHVLVEIRGKQIQTWLNALQRSYYITLRYFRALKVVDRVLEAVLQLKLSKECRRSLLQMTHCAHCAGQPGSTQTCSGLCLNTLRGCLVDLTDLAKPIRYFSQALIAMKNYVTNFDLYTQVALLSSNIFFLTSDISANFEDIQEAIQHCPIEQARSSEVVRRQAGPNDNRPRLFLQPPRHTLNSSAFCLLNHVNFFSELPEALCRGQEISQENKNCWNGQQFGDYLQDVVGFTRSEQADNPEVEVCTGHRQFLPQLQLLRFITKELNTLTGACSEDDEDCLKVTPTTRYYDLDAIDLTSVEVCPESGESGSGSGEGMNDDDLEDTIKESSVKCDSKTIPY